MIGWLKRRSDSPVRKGFVALSYFCAFLTCDFDDMNMKEEHRKILDDKVQNIILRTMHLRSVMDICKEILRRNKITLKIERRQAEYSKMEDEHIAGIFYAKEDGGYENDKNDVIVMRAGLKLQEQEETIAHELGHYFTRRLQIYEGYGTEGQQKLEEEKADYFMQQMQIWFAFRDLLKKRKEKEKVLKKVV